MKMSSGKQILLGSLFAVALALPACSNDSVKTEAKYPSGLDRNQTGGARPIQALLQRRQLEDLVTNYQCHLRPFSFCTRFFSLVCW